jgi:hypothetical protein
MDAYDRCTNLGEKILLILLPSMVEAENFSDHPLNIKREKTSFVCTEKVCKSTACE